MKQEMKQKQESDVSSIYMMIAMFFAGAATMLGLVKAFGSYDNEAEAPPPAIQESELAEVLTKLDTLRTGLNVVHANQSFMWTNGIVKLRQGQNLLLRAQLKAGTLKVEKKETTTKEKAE